jgi:hypothetical protein
MVSTQATNDLTEELNKLAKLHADGMLSDQEFTAIKAKMIAEISPTFISTIRGYFKIC